MFKNNPILNEEAEASQAENQANSASYALPPFTLLNQPYQNTEGTQAEDKIIAHWLEELLASHDEPAKVINVSHGPAVTRFDLELPIAKALKNRTGMEKSFAAELSVKTVRIVPPYPGKRQFSIEVPTKKATIVTLREMLESDQMQKEDSPLAFALGKDTNNTPVISVLDKKSFTLITGQTASGKSVCIHAIINTLLFRTKPDEVKMVLIDPSGTELQRYNGIPHLMAPVISDPRKAVAALNWAISETEKRFSLFRESDIIGFDNHNLELKKAGKEPLSRIVIVIDEFADIWLANTEDDKKTIKRLLERASAVGIHPVIATRYYSDYGIDQFLWITHHDTITFRMAKSEHSSFSLHDKSEYLLGWGDLFYINASPFFPARIQGCHISDYEIDRVVDYIRKESPASYVTNLMETIENTANKDGYNGKGKHS